MRLYCFQVLIFYPRLFYTVKNYYRTIPGKKNLHNLTGLYRQHKNQLIINYTKNPLLKTVFKKIVK